MIFSLLRVVQCLPFLYDNDFAYLIVKGLYNLIFD